jgi:hypothetical protein
MRSGGWKAGRNLRTVISASRHDFAPHLGLTAGILKLIAGRIKASLIAATARASNARLHD